MAGEPESMRREGDGWLERKGPFDVSIPLDWHDLESGLGEKGGRKRPVFPKPDSAPRPCELCGQPTEWQWWSSDALCWKNHCRRAGYVEVCLPCRAWYPLTGSLVLS
ncbi:MAG: hypothetical protein KF733_03535 [Fimbriimonadaceae bacterium]|nr:MAG: hypothetical protein KF733_03535 [Fimbriimonadaceae bacterium]